MSVLAPHPVTTATSFEKDASNPFNIEQRRRLKEFNIKFSKYLPTFNVGVLRQHLLFLKATYRIFSSIDQPFVVEDKVDDRKVPTPATRVFLSKALYRFEVWLNEVVDRRASDNLKPLDEDELPPLDVLIILHSYRLAPWIYDEDLSLRFPQLTKIGNFPFDNIVRKLDVITAEYQPSIAQIQKWEKMTGLPFDASAMGNTVFITCPACSNTLSVPWTCGPTACDGGTGFAETGFTVNCPKCDLKINHDALATAKFVRDLIACQDMEDTILAGTLISGNGSVNVETAKMITAEIKKTLGDCRADLGTKLSWSMKTVATLIHNDPDSQIKKSRIADVLRPYQQDSPFSTDLVYKAAIQGDFAARTNAKGFFEEDFLQQENNTWLADGIKAYRLFIKLVLMPHMPKVYPTYAIDLVWHTHQLSADYKAQLLDIVGVFIDHRSQDEIAPTSAVFEAARDAWKDLLLAAGLPPLESHSGLPGAKHSNSSGCSQSASQALKEDSVLALELLDNTADFIYDPPAPILSPLEVKEALES